MATRKIAAAYVDENGVVCVNACCDEANSDWIRAARLKKAADKGNKKAKEKLEKLEDTPMLEEDGE